MKNDLSTDQKRNMIFYDFCHIHTFASIEVIFNIFENEQKFHFLHFKTFTKTYYIKELDHLYGFEKMHFVVEKSVFSLFFYPFGWKNLI